MHARNHSSYSRVFPHVPVKPVAHILFPGSSHFKSFPLSFQRELNEPITAPITAAGWPSLKQSVVYKGKVKSKALKQTEEQPITLSYLFSFELPTGSQCATGKQQ